MTTSEVVYAVVISLPTLFALWAKVEAARAKVEAARAAVRGEDNSVAIAELNTSLVSITNHIDGKMDALLKTSMALSKMEGINQERERHEGEQNK